MVGTVLPNTRFEFVHKRSAVLTGQGSYNSTDSSVVVERARRQNCAYVKNPRILGDVPSKLQ